MTKHQLALDVVCKSTRVSRKKIVSRSRTGDVVEARNLFILLLAQDGVRDEIISWTLNRCRPSITHSRHTAKRLIESSAVFRNKYAQIKERYEYQKSLRVS